MKKTVREARPELFEKSVKTKETANAKGHLDSGKSLLSVLIKMTSEPNSQQLSDDGLFGIYLTLFWGSDVHHLEIAAIRLYLLAHHPQYKVQILEEAC